VFNCLPPPTGTDAAHTVLGHRFVMSNLAACTAVVKVKDRAMRKKNLLGRLIFRSRVREDVRRVCLFLCVKMGIAASLL